MNKVTYLVSLICILLFSSCEEDKVYYNTAAKADFTIGEDMYELGQTAVFKDASIPDEEIRLCLGYGNSEMRQSLFQWNRILPLSISRMAHLPSN
ncbi:hypothetical protein SFC43_02685 [Bacteroides sp. CR5/BHMF/2]|nr:hypothetical protein [Bacteroides sp. CR5/BHMF/2]